jgi:4-amino-4-deoxy-L-arabinose transferase-like glycosyltransferase
MATAEEPPAPEHVSGAGGPPRRWAWSGLAVVLLGGLALRLWGVGQGLPYAYNSDEADHFVPRAVRMFADGSLNPHYFANPPALTYLLHVLFALAYGGAGGVVHAFDQHPGEVYTLARVAVALLGTAALWLLYATGARLFGRAVGLLAAAIEAVAFLPVFYAHLALNDVPTLAPLTLSLLATAGVARKGRRRDYALAGVALGLACATKYTAGIVIVPLLTASVASYLDGEEVVRRRTAQGLLLAGVGALGAFLLANPYAVLDYSSFHAELAHQSTLSAEGQGKLGAPKEGGFLYYLWSLTWGLGWVPALAALGGALTIWRSRPRLGWLLVPATVLFLAFMGLQGRYFGRWLLPIFPIVCLLAGFFVVDLIERARRLTRLSLSPAAWVALAVALVVGTLAQGLVYSIHSGLVLARADTRALTRDWMLAHIPVGAKVVVEPVAPDDWARLRPGAATASNPFRWPKYPSLLPRVSATGQLEAEHGREVGIEDYETTLWPVLIDYYEANDYCWVISGSTQSGRAFADPRAVPHAAAYYRALAQQGEVVYSASPYADGDPPVAFDFDWSFDYYPLAYTRPGPRMTIYRLHGGRCGAG